MAIIPGTENPLLVKPRQIYPQQAAKLVNWPHGERFANRNPIDFLADRILAYPGEVTLLSIAPLTNIALLFKVYPQVISVLKALVMM